MSGLMQHTEHSILEDAKRFLVGGVNSPVRAFRRIGTDPVILTQASGAEVVDIQGRRFVDFIGGWGALILGHNPPPVIRALHQAMERGVLFGLTHPAEIELARAIVQAVPSVEQLRLTVSGTEACMTAVKLARAHTGRSKIMIFEGCYHGHGESLMTGQSAGIPELLAREVVRVPYNDGPAFDEAIARFGDELACTIIEPVAANMGVVVPDAGYLARIRAATRERGILLIFDEVVTGFRLGPGGAQQYFGVAPDLTTFGKIIGGGLPIGAVGGPSSLMRRLAPEGDVYHAGTFAGHPLSVAAGLAALTQLAAEPPYEPLEQLTRRLTEQLSALASACGIPLRINRAGSTFTVFFDRPDRFAAWATYLLAEGVLVPPSPVEALFISTAHTDAHVDWFLKAARGALDAMRRD